MKLKAVIFDLGKVLLNYSFEKTFAFWSVKSGIPVERIQNSFVIDPEYKKHETGAVTIEQYYSHICTVTGMKIGLEDFIDGWNALFIGLYPETLPLLNALDPGVKKILLSNTNQTHTVFLRRNYGQLLDLFDTVYFSNEIQRRKPDPETFTYVLNACGLQAHETLFFDDIEENISGAESVHITGILVRNPENIATGLQKYGLIG